MVMAGLGARAQEAMAAGVAQEAIVLDPGFGFGKAFEENFPLLLHFEELQGRATWSEHKQILGRPHSAHAMERGERF